MKDSPLHSNQPGPMSHLLSLAMRQWLCPGSVSLSLAATATAATASLQPSPAAAAPPRPACLAPRLRDAAAAPCDGARHHHPMQALPGDEEGDAAPRRHPPTRTGVGGAACCPHGPTAPEPLSSDAAPLATAATRRRRAPHQGPAFAVRYRRCPTGRGGGAARGPPCRSRRRRRRRRPCPARQRPCPCHM